MNEIYMPDGKLCLYKSHWDEISDDIDRICKLKQKG